MTLKTYSHLAENKMIPSEYEIATTKLHYYPDRGFEVKMPLESWYAKYQTESHFSSKNWERFADPRHTTYSAYTKIQSAKESFVMGIFQSMESQKFNEQLSPEWRLIYEQVFTPLRYPCHGLQMMAAYIGQMAPASRVTIAAAFQTADEIRRIQWLAYRQAMIADSFSDFGANSKIAWQKDALWQPLRKLIETLLVTYDWGEAFVALNLVVKPAFDKVFMEDFAAKAHQMGDYLIPEIFGSLNEDCLWHQTWSEALMEVLEEEGNEVALKAVGEWEDKWRPLAEDAMKPFTKILR
jgi:hypothetical protein